LEQEMNYRCKDGDLAIVIQDEPICAGNVGKVVQVRGPIMLNSRLKLMCWLIKPVNRQLWHCVRSRGEHYTSYVTWKKQMEHPDSWLLPLRPDDGLSADGAILTERLAGSKRAQNAGIDARPRRATVIGLNHRVVV
jgi:hypothetical protein